ncbi:MAG: HAMP domain-containing protein, partial [Burkholderiaceae bacterium]
MLRSLLSRLKLWQKFVLLDTLGAILVAVPLMLYIQESNKSVDTAALEASGIQTERTLLKAIQLAQQHRGLSSMVLSGNAEAKDKRAAKQEEVVRVFAELDTTVKQAGNTRADAIWQKLKSDWPTLANKVASQSLTPKESFTEHTALIEQLFAINDLFLDHFGLSLDPEIDSYYLVDATLMRLPKLTEALGRLRAKGSGLLIQKTLTLEDRIMMGAMVENANGLNSDIKTSLEKAIAANSTLQDKVGSLKQTAFSSGEKGVQLVQTQVIKAEQLTLQSADYFAQMTDVIDAQFKLNDAALTELSSILNARQSHLRVEQYILLTIILALIALTGLAGWIVLHAIIDPLSEAVGIAKKIAAGDLTSNIQADGTDETAELLIALRDMNESLMRIVTDVRIATDTIATASGQIASGNMDLS